MTTSARHARNTKVGIKKKKIITTIPEVGTEAKGSNPKKGKWKAKEEDNIIQDIDKAVKRADKLFTKTRP
jgi:hypothetical protein